MRRQVVARLVVLGLLVATLALGVGIRLRDPLSTRAMAAEDPYTHVVFTKEWLDQGYFSDSFHMGTAMYPPGMHAFAAAFAPFAGVPLFEFARLAPAIISAVAILGMFAVGTRLSGHAAGLGAAFVTAIMPEHAFRSELFFPTAFDLALMPLWILAFHAAISAERWAGSALFVACGVMLALMHPWAVVLIAAPLAIYAVLRAQRVGDGFRATAIRLSRAAAILILPTAIAMATRWNTSDTGFSDFLAHLGPLAPLANPEAPPFVVFLGVLLLLGAAAAVGTLAVAAATTWQLPRAARRAVFPVVGAGLLALFLFLGREPPREVHYRIMLGIVGLTLGIAGFLLAFVKRSALGDIGVSLVLVLFPLTAIDIFNNPYWPHRTVAFLSLGVAFLAGSAIQQAYEGAIVATRGRLPRMAIPAIATALVLGVAGAAAATAKPPYKWYRLYDDAEFAAFERAVDRLEAAEGARVFTYTWQPALFVKTLGDPNYVWYSPDFFQSEAKRLDQAKKVHGPAYVVVDEYTLRAEEKGKNSLDFVEDASRYRLVDETPDGRFRFYQVIAR